MENLCFLISVFVGSYLVFRKEVFFVIGVGRKERMRTGLMCFKYLVGIRYCFRCFMCFVYIDFLM